MNSKELNIKMKELMARALEDPGPGMRALAAAIAPAIRMQIDLASAAPLLFTENDLPAGEESKHTKRAAAKAYMISPNGDVVWQEMEGEDVVFPFRRYVSSPTIDVSVLEHGNVGKMMDFQRDASSAVKTAIDAAAASLISAAATTSVTITGKYLTEDGLNTTMGAIEDKGLAVKYLLMRGSRMTDMKTWGLDPETRREMNQKGIFKLYNGAQIINVPSMSAGEVICIPDHEVGKMDVRKNLSVDYDEIKRKFKIGWIVWKELSLGIVRDDLLFKVVITG